MSKNNNNLNVSKLNSKQSQNTNSFLNKAQNHLSKYIIESEIGRGASGICYKVHHIHQKKPFVMKKIQVTSHSLNINSSPNKNLHHNSRLKTALSQVHILSQLKHPNIIKYYDSFADDQYLYIIMEYAPKGDLHRIIKRKKIKGNSYEEKQVWEMMEQILLALSYLHKNNIIHRDVKTLNVMVGSDNTLMLGDLGVSKMIQTDLALYSRVGTPLYLAPQIIKYEKYDFKADVWGAGCIAYILSTLTHPFQGKNIISLGQNIVSIQPKHINYFLGSTSCTKYSDELNNFIMEMLIKDPNKRPSIDYLLKKYYNHENQISKNLNKKTLFNSKKQIIDNQITQKINIQNSKRNLVEFNQSPISKRKLNTSNNYNIPNNLNNPNNSSLTKKNISLLKNNSEKDSKNIREKQIQNMPSKNSIQDQIQSKQKLQIQINDKKNNQSKEKQPSVRYMEIEANNISYFVEKSQKNTNYKQPSFSNNQGLNNYRQKQQQIRTSLRADNQYAKNDKINYKRPGTAFRNNYLSMLKPQKQFKSATNVNKLLFLVEQNLKKQKSTLLEVKSIAQLRKDHNKQFLSNQIEQNTIIKPINGKIYNFYPSNPNQELTYVNTKSPIKTKQFKEQIKQQNAQRQSKNTHSKSGASYSLRNRHFYHSKIKNNKNEEDKKLKFDKNQLLFEPDQIIQDIGLVSSTKNYAQQKRFNQKDKKIKIQSQLQEKQKGSMNFIHSSQQKIRNYTQLCKKNCISVKNVSNSPFSNNIKTEQIQNQIKKSYNIVNRNLQDGKINNFFPKKVDQQKNSIIKMSSNIVQDQQNSHMKRLKSTQNYYYNKQVDIRKDNQDRVSQGLKQQKQKPQIKYYRPRPQTSINRKVKHESMMKDVRKKRMDQSNDFQSQVSTQILKKPEMILL